MQKERTLPTRTAKEQFDRQAFHYDKQWNNWNYESLDWLLHAPGLQPTDRVLDVATGGGFSALAFALRAGNVFGLVISTGMLDQARQRARDAQVENVSFEEGAAECLPFPDGSFECVTCRVAAHHFVDVSKFVKESARVLVPSGLLLVADTTVPDADTEAAEWQNTVETLRDPSHVRNYAPSEWRSLLEAEAFIVKELLTTGGGITIPLSDWMLKSGCTGNQAAAVRRSFVEAPDSAREQFDLKLGADGEIVFTWQRMCIIGQKKAS